MPLSVTIERDDTARLLRSIGPVTAAESAAVAAELARLLQRHLRARDASHAHQYPDGGRRSHFWRKAAESVSFASDATSSTVTVTHQGVRLRYAGAPKGIGPVNAGALAIPAAPEAYGRLPREISDLRIVVFKGKNKAALVQKPGKGEYLGKVMFWLIRRTKRIAADPTVLPPAQVVLGMSALRIRQSRTRSVFNGQ